MKKYLYWSKGFYFLLLFLAFLDAVLEAGIALVIEYLVNNISSDSFDITTFIGYGAAALGYAVIMITCFFGYNSYVAWYLNKAVKRLSDDVFSSLMEKNTASFQENNVSSYLSVLMNDCTRVANQYLGPMLSLPGFILTYLAALAMSLYINWAIALFLLAFSFLVFLVPYFFNKPMNLRNEEIQKAFSNLSSQYQNFLQGHDVVRSLSAYDYVFEKESRSSMKAYRAAFRQSRLSLGVSSLSSLLTTVLQISVIVGSGIIASQGGLAFGAVLAFIQLANNLYNPLSSFATSVSSIKGMSSVNASLLTLTTQEFSKKDKIELDGRLSVQDLSFSYGEKEIISHFSYSFEPGKKYLIEGESGSGKSTLLRLLSDSGEPYVGTIEASGHDYRDLSFKTVASAVYYCEQTSRIFPGTLKENVLFGSPYDDGKFTKAIRLAGLVDFVKERGTDTLLDPELNSSSGGETQRIALARAIYHEPKILLLDEITSGLDEMTNRSIQESILGLPMTIVFVCHNVLPSLPKQFDGTLEMRKCND
ncbi:MAG: ABC transporter ATP-binding protein/permease [Bacilli bacterium]|jgi:ABC-type multidrug transport system fused ATPase/permease subunit|nr:ABC transporter ATP-binding protein/permease [Bacilli bacterium]MCI2111652.1 ABC transporter ATP-binding protein/permease [Bacilli bacterium]